MRNTEDRYVLVQSTDGTWAIHDGMTRLPAATNGTELSGMHRTDADDIAALLNREHRRNGKNPLL